MKKAIVLTISILLVITSVFAYKSFVNFGMGYKFDYGKVFHDGNVYFGRNDMYRDSMVDFNLEYQGEWKNGLTVYERTDVGFGRGLDLKKEDMDFEDQNHLRNVAVAESVGFGYTFHPSDNFRISLCAGPHFDAIIYAESVKGEDIPEVIENFGVEINANANVYLGRHFALNFSVIPCFNFFNINASYEYDNVLESGAATGFSVLAVAGVSLKF